jgi:hypothetical protein
MEPESLSLCSKESVIGLHSEEDESNLPSAILFLWDSFSYYPPIYTYVFQQVFSSGFVPFLLHAPPILY